MKLALAAPLLLAAARLAPAAPLTLEEARDLLQQSAQAGDPQHARDLAAAAADGFRAAWKPKESDCWLLAVTIEAHLRAAQPEPAREALSRAVGQGCEPAVVNALSGWAYELAPDGTRRSPGADLVRAQAAYLKAAEHLAGRAPAVDDLASALANAGEIALLLGDTAAARQAGLRGLRAKPAGELAVRNALVVLGAAGPELGEGAATDLVAEHVGADQELLAAILDARVAQVGQQLELRPGDPHLLAAAGFYALFTAGEIAADLALRHLDTAAASGFPLPELSYLRGRAHFAAGRHAEAKEHWLRQQREFPAAAASRLAANDLAHLLATEGGPPAEMSAALAALDAHLKRTPREAAMHETRALLLERMGRREEAVAAMEQALGIERTPEREREVGRLRAAP